MGCCLSFIQKSNKEDSNNKNKQEKYQFIDIAYKEVMIDSQQQQEQEVDISFNSNNSSPANFQNTSKQSKQKQYTGLQSMDSSFEQVQSKEANKFSTLQLKIKMAPVIEKINQIFDEYEIKQKYLSKNDQQQENVVLQQKNEETGGKYVNDQKEQELQAQRIEQQLSPIDFDILKIIGRGTYAKVLLVRKKDSGKVYAMKVISKKKLMQEKHNASYLLKQIQMEKELMFSLSNPFIVQINYSFEMKEKVYFVMEFLSGGRVFYHLKQEKMFNEEKVKIYSAQIVLALHYLHQKGIIYRDLKPENVILDKNGIVKLTDFGIAKKGVKGLKKSYTFCGTNEYCAPEFIQGKGHNKAVDWWCLGIMIYEMLSGSCPFKLKSKNRQELFQAITKDPIKRQNEFSNDAWSLISSLLIRDPSKRLGGQKEDAAQIISHNFFKGIDWEKLALLQFQPPFIPQLSKEEDVNYIEKDFLQNESALMDSSIQDSSKEIQSKKKDLFRDFSI